MATKNKKIETRLDPETYAALEEVAENFEMSTYAVIRRFIFRGIDEVRRPDNIPPTHRAVSLMVSNEVYEILDKLANEYGGTVPDVVWTCVLDVIERRKFK